MQGDPVGGEVLPLVSFALFAYNQEKYIRGAVAAALAQTYSPLEIILSDDHSADGTFEIMQAMVEGYSGPHRIVLNRNERNLYIGGHINKVMALARGELVVVAAGDDISEPERTSRIVAFYLEHNRPVGSIYSDARIMDSNGTVGAYHSVACPDSHFTPVNYAGHKFHGLLGATHAWHRGLFDQLGPLPPDLTFEDDAIPFRASLLGGVLHIPEALVRYRRHAESVMKQEKNLVAENLLNQKRFITLFDSNLRDLLHYSSFIAPGFAAKDECLWAIVRQRHIAQYLTDIVGGNLLAKLRGMLLLAGTGSFTDIKFCMNYGAKRFLFGLFGREFIQSLRKKVCP